MRKREKLRISQDTKPWVGLTKRDEDSFFLFNKLNLHNRSGNQRNREVILANAGFKAEASKLLLQSFLLDQTSFDKTSNYRLQLFLKFFRVGANSGLSRPKNFCVVSGKRRTFNRDFSLSRQVFRKLARFGLVQGLRK